MATDMELMADKYLKNRCTPEEAGEVLEWLDTEPGKTYLQNQLNKDLQLLENDNLYISPANVPGADMFNSILYQIRENEQALQPKEPAKVIDPALKIVPVRRSGFVNWYKAAALVAGLSLGAVAAYQYFAERTISRSTRYGETARVILPDSSAVTLNGNSSIEYAANWNSNETRKVNLEGEAFFSVKHKNNNQKFIVTTADTIQVEVLGTEFNISDRKNQTQVVLVSGKIRLDMQWGHQQKSSVTMNPGESVEIRLNNNGLHKHQVDPSVVTSWTGNKLIFDNTSVRDICIRLKETYGYDISVPDQKIMNQHITGSVPNQSIDMVLEGLEAIMDIKFKKRSTTDK